MWFSAVKELLVKKLFFSYNVLSLKWTSEAVSQLARSCTIPPNVAFQGSPYTSIRIGNVVMVIMLVDPDLPAMG